jgi:5'-3' exonuclease
MGIPYYFYYLTTKYTDIIINKLPDNIDIYAIDFNGIIHG